MVAKESHLFLERASGCYGSQWLLWNVNDCNIDNCCYRKSMVAMESHWLLLKVKGCYEKSMVAMDSHWLPWKVSG
jgi:hypothetical protein